MSSKDLPKLMMVGLVLGIVCFWKLNYINYSSNSKFNSDQSCPVKSQLLMYLLNDLSLGHVFGVGAAGEGAVKKIAKALIDHSFMRKGKRTSWQ